jgi:hypothetical protein
LQPFFRYDFDLERPGNSKIDKSSFFATDIKRCEIIMNDSIIILCSRKVNQENDKQNKNKAHLFGFLREIYSKTTDCPKKKHVYFILHLASHPMTGFHLASSRSTCILYPASCILYPAPGILHPASGIIISYIRTMETENKQYPEGHFVGMWIGIGMVLFAGIGIPLSIVLENPGFFGIGPAIGVAFGAGIGASIESKKKKEGLIRPLTAKEKKTRKNLVIAGLIFLMVGVALLLYFFFRA